MTISKVLLVLLAVAAIAAGCTENRQGELDELMHAMEGSYYNFEQAAENPEFAELFFHAAPIWEGRDDHRWLYVEQGVTDLPNKPYYQRFYELKYVDDRLCFDIYYVQDQFPYLGRWRTPEFFDTIDGSSLILRENCTVFLKKESDGHYIGASEGIQCGSKRKDIAYLRRQVRIGPDDMDIWERGYDFEDNHVFGPDAGPYQFKKARDGDDSFAKALRELANAMTGTFSSASQAAADTNYLDITLHMYEIWPGQPGVIWLYVEQAMTAIQDKPYRQRIYKLQQEADGEFSSTVFTLPDEAQYIGQWKDPFFFNKISPEHLRERIGCTVYLTKQEDGSWKGSTRDKECESGLRGAEYATSTVEVSGDRIISWDQGWNTDDEQVWGATAGGYEFVRLVE
jgi:hypothetical protein